MKERTHYDVLGVPRDADSRQIKNAYREIAKEHHPDKGSGGDPERFHEAQEAYEVLGDRSNREQYDCELAGRDLNRNARAAGPDGMFFTGFGDGFEPDEPRSRPGRPHSPFFRAFGGVDPLFDSILEELFGTQGDPFADSSFGGDPLGDDPFADAGGFNDLGSRIRFGAGARARQADTPFVKLRVALSPAEVAHGVDAEVEIPVRGACPRCRELGSWGGRFCPVCRGAGTVERTDQYTLEIPAGTPHGSRREFRLEEDGLQTEVQVTVVHERRMR